MTYLLCTLSATFFVLAGYLMEHGQPVLLLQPAEFVIVAFPSLLMGIAATSGRAFRQSWSLVFASPARVETRDARQVCRFLKVCGAMALTMGVAATLLGLVITLSFMDAPPLVLGEKLGATVVGILIGLFFRSTSYVAEQRVRGRYLMAAEEGRGVDR